MKSRFLNAMSGSNESQIPIWLMRQAGRYLPEYQELRKKHDFRTLSHTPSLICETTLTPFKRFNMDAAILFSDILTCLEYMGSPFVFGEAGPELKDHGTHVLAKLKSLDPEKDMSFVGEGIELVVQKLGDTPLIGFVGAPFTLVSYLIEGGTSREFTETRRFIYEKPDEFVRVMDLLGDSVARYLLFQAKCGARTVQIFDSWVGVLPKTTYDELIAPTMKKLIATVRAAGIPVILYSQPTLHLLPTLESLSPTALSVDWRTPIKELYPKLKNQKLVIQGNLDPLVTTLDWQRAKPFVNEILDNVSELGIKPRYVFNVGHGVLPETKWETVGKIVDFVHENS
jgi:uroporphyrinogen decarboxylase